MTEESSKRAGTADARDAADAMPAKRRGRVPNPEKTRATRAAIVQAALAVFLEKGFEGARMIDVARAAGLAKGTLYLYFPTKEALFEGVLTDALGSPLGEISRLPAKGESVRDFILSAALPVLRDLESSGRADLLRLIIREGPRFPEIAVTYRRVVLDPGWAAVQTLAATARARGELRDDALERLPILLVAPAVVATLWNGLFSDDQMDTARAFQTFVDAIFVPPD